MSMPICPCCGSISVTKRVKGKLQCHNCGHEGRASTFRQADDVVDSLLDRHRERMPGGGMKRKVAMEDAEWD